LKFNQSHPTTLCGFLRLTIYAPGSGATSGSGFFPRKIANPIETKSGKITYICGAGFKNKQYKVVMELG